MNTKAKGARAERRARKQLERDGYLVVKAGGSLGLFDLVAIRKDGVRLIQIKSNTAPRRAERERMEAFTNCPSGTRREVWIYRDRVRDPVVGVL